MKIAIEGCMHGDLDNVYKTIADIERSQNTKIDLLLCCGDFQAVRNKKDLDSLCVPAKFKAMKTFWKYYSGKAVAPVPTVFIGGNHEASNYLWELYYGGWAAPNIYFMGFAGVIKFGNVRIGGLSGIYKAHHYRLGHFERPPYNKNEIRSIYHVREYDVMKLMQIEEPIDIFLSHDWPVGITDCGNSRELIKKKPFFQKEIEDRTLGSKPAAKLLDELKPSYWFSAHLHCKFSALVQHGESGSVTKFLALDKCESHRQFLQVIEIPSEPGPYEFHFDEEWLAITRALHPAFPLTMRADLRNVQIDKEGCRQWVKNRLKTKGDKPFDFVQTAPCYDPNKSAFNARTVELYRNPQTEALLRLLELPYLIDGSVGPSDMYDNSAPGSTEFSDNNSEDIPIDDVDELEEFSVTD